MAKIIISLHLKIILFQSQGKGLLVPDSGGDTDNCNNNVSNIYILYVMDLCLSIKYTIRKHDYNNIV